MHLHLEQLLAEIEGCLPEASTPAEAVRLLLKISPEQPCFVVQFADLLPQPLHLLDGVCQPCHERDGQCFSLCHVQLQLSMRAPCRVVKAFSRNWSVGLADAAKRF